jgi:hypothetical protein
LKIILNQEKSHIYWDFFCFWDCLLNLLGFNQQTIIPNTRIFLAHGEVEPQFAASESNRTHGNLSEENGNHKQA